LRAVKWIDEFGFHRVNLVRDTDPDSYAPRGIPVAIPEITTRIDWAEVAIEMQNALVDAGLLTWEDVQKSGDTLIGVILGATKKRIITLYRQNGG